MCLVTMDEWSGSPMNPMARWTRHCTWWARESPTTLVELISRLEESWLACPVTSVELQLLLESWPRSTSSSLRYLIQHMIIRSQSRVAGCEGGVCHGHGEEQCWSGLLCCRWDHHQQSRWHWPVSCEWWQCFPGVRIRVGNTDAEGRMAMVDVLCHAKEKALHDPSKIRLFKL